MIKEVYPNVVYQCPVCLTPVKMEYGGKIECPTCDFTIPRCDKHAIFCPYCGGEMRGIVTDHNEFYMCTVCNISVTSTLNDNKPALKARQNRWNTIEFEVLQ